MPFSALSPLLVLRPHSLTPRRCVATSASSVQEKCDQRAREVQPTKPSSSKRTEPRKRPASNCRCLTSSSLLFSNAQQRRPRPQPSKATLHATHSSTPLYAHTTATSLIPPLDGWAHTTRERSAYTYTATQPCHAPTSWQVTTQLNNESTGLNTRWKEGKEEMGRRGDSTTKVTGKWTAAAEMRGQAPKWTHSLQRGPQQRGVSQCTEDDGREKEGTMQRQSTAHPK